MDKLYDDAYLFSLYNREIYLSDLMRLKNGEELSLDHIEAALFTMLERSDSCAYLSNNDVETSIA
jgi:hypothetical protein